MILAPAIGRIFVHMPKTSGTWWTALLLATAGADRVEGQHSPGVATPSPLRAAYPLFGVLRDPASWYASAWEHAMAGDDRQREQLRVWGDGSNDFPSVLSGWTSGHLPARVADCPGVLWHQYARRRIEWVEGEGLWSFAVRYFFRDAEERWLVDELVEMTNGSNRAAQMGLVVTPPKNTRRDRQRLQWARETTPTDTFTPEMHRAIGAADGAMLQDASRLVRAA